MLELTSPRKSKINLSDYPLQQDVDSRILFSEATIFDLEVLEAILFSPLKILVKKLAHSLNSSEEELKPILQKLSSVGLIQVQNGILTVDKERRKYFEFQIARFEDHFRPNLEFLHGLLKQVPIHILPSWYAISRTSNNIIESILEKTLLSPHTYQRSLEELHTLDPIYGAIVDDLFSSLSLQIPTSQILTKYSLTQRTFEEILLQLEFRFICFATYRKVEGHWQEWVVPFFEWQQHLSFLKETEAPSVNIDHASEEFAFIKEMETFLKQKEGREKVVQKTLFLKLAEMRGGQLTVLENAKEWLKLSLEQRALSLYRNPDPFYLERNVREAEKVVKRVLHGNWVFFDDVLKGTKVWLREDQKLWQQWKISIYNEEERDFLKAVVFDWLFECGMVKVGTYQGRDCFAVTPFGQNFFEE